jgi:hypothetical protein
MRNWTAAWTVGAMVAVGGTAVSAQDIAETRIAIPVTAHASDAASVAQLRAVRPAPIQAALELLRWPADQVPLVEVVEVRPSRVNILAEGWVMRYENGNARPKIYIAGWSPLYRGALANPGRNQDAIRLASVLAHERSHLEHGADEERAYLAQLSTLERLQATNMDRTSVRVALRAVTRQQLGHR